MTRHELAARAHALIERLAGGGRDDRARDDLLRDLLAWQARSVEPYARLVAARGVDPDGARGPADFPALPTDVFRWSRVAAHPREEDVRIFRTSGTTSGTRGMHALRDLSLYDRAARAAARFALFPDVDRIRMVMLAPDEQTAPDSSLSYMLSRFAEWFGEGEPVWAWTTAGVDVEQLRAVQALAQADGAPVALLGTSFAFVHADEALSDVRLPLPPGSRIMQTGGFKGRAREVEPAAMRAMLRERYALDETRIVAEYGMTELSSQMYETTLCAPQEPRRLWVPGWVRAVPVDPETLAPVPDGEVGILRIDDVANVDTAAAIQTADLARRTGDGIDLLGRVPGSLPRGCSLAVEEALGGGDGG